MNSAFRPGLVHAPVTPFTREHAIDYATYGRLIEFHLRHGAEALVVPAPEAEDLSLTDAEQRALLEFALRRVAGRVPVIAHVSDAGTGIAVARARHAQAAGAAAIVSHPPYFWHPRPAMVLEHLASIGAAVELPFYVYTPPVESPGTKMTTEITLELIRRLDNFAGVADQGMDWVYMIEVISNGRALRPDFQLLSATDYMVSAAVIGGSGAISGLAAVAPRLVREVYELCRAEKYKEARVGQEALATLRHLLKGPRIETGLKAALRAMGRDCGRPRPPLRALGEVEYGRIAEALAAMPFLRAEPRGW